MSKLYFPNLSQAETRGRQYVAMALIVSAAVVAIKVALAWNLKASAMFSDDYAYLNKSIYYVHAQWDMPGYIFQNVFAGILYPLAISPWMLFQMPETRIFTVFVINAIMSGVAVYFGSLAVRTAAGRPFWPAPFCIAAFVPMFLFSFVAMTENLLYPLLAMAAWLCADFDRTLKSRWRFPLLCLCVALAPLVRAPGLAIGAAVFIMIASSCWRIGWLRAGVCCMIVFAATLAPYFITMSWAPVVNSQVPVKREARYLGTIATILEEPWYWWIVLRIAFSQIKYLVLVTGGFSLFALLATCFTRRSRADGSINPLRHLRTFTILCSFLMLTIIELHIIRKIHFNVSSADFIFGRYVDPIAFVVLLAGLAALPALRRLRLKTIGAWILRVLAPVVIALAVARAWNDPDSASFNQTGLAAFCGTPNYPIEYALVAVAAIAAIFQIPWRRRAFSGLLLACFLAFSVYGSARGMDVYVYPRAELIARSQEAASWLATHSPGDAKIGFDRKVFRADAPTWRTMGLHFQALVFAIYPRSCGFVGDDDTMRQFDYLFSSTLRDPVPKLPVKWTNGDYVLYQVVNDVAVYDPNEMMPLSEPASPDIIMAEQRANVGMIQASAVVLDFSDLRSSCCPGDIPFDDCDAHPVKIKNNSSQLTLAWKDSKVTTPLCALSAGSYALRVRARADGCPNDAPNLHVSAPKLVDRDLRISPRHNRCYNIPFVLDKPGHVAFTFVFTNNGLCGPEDRRIDKNIYIDSLSIIPVQDNSPPPLLTSQ